MHIAISETILTDSGYLIHKQLRFRKNSDKASVFFKYPRFFARVYAEIQADDNELSFGEGHKDRRAQRQFYNFARTTKDINLQTKKTTRTVAKAASNSNCYKS